MTIPRLVFDDRLTSVVANLILLGVIGCGAFLYGFDRDAYYFAVQEDQFLEWSSFWAFLAAALVYLIVARRYRISGKPIWFTLAFALFCLIIALEEISWGQRLFGYRPPDYFLANNFQQELNLHNVVSTDFRKLAVRATILSFALFLPLLSLVPMCGRFFNRVALPVPPFAIAPALLTAYILYEWYPWTHTGEWVELMLGFGFLFGAMHALGPQAKKRSVLRVLIGCVGVLIAGTVSASVFSAQWTDPTEKSVAAATELEALGRDFAGSGLGSRCNVHKRLYTYVEQYDRTFLLTGDFAGLADRGLPAGRAEFLLDPWNSPYWLRDSCAKKGRGRTAFVYSFGPNRRRDSSRTEILGDDIGVFIDSSNIR